jgi:hypothetical protein
MAKAKKNKKKPAAKALIQKPLTIMVSSSVYGTESDLDSIYAILKGFGYNVIMSKEGTVYVPVGGSTVGASIKAVQDCDLFLGIIFPRYGSGITHEEFKEAIRLDKPRWFIAHHYVTFAREILKQYMFRGKKRNRSFKFKRTGIMDDVRVVEMYNDAIQNHLPLHQRKSNWVQPFFKTSEIMPFLETQFKDVEKRRTELLGIKKKVNKLKK